MIYFPMLSYTQNTYVNAQIIDRKDMVDWVYYHPIEI
jgi:hypothetical protein